MYIKIVGIEGRSNFTLVASYNLMSNYNIFCAKTKDNKENNNPPVTIYPSVCLLENIGTVTFGGKDLLTNDINNDLYLLNNQNLNWEKIKYNSGNVPEARYGALASCYNNYLVLFSSK